MKILLHICCGPCAIYPLKIIRGLGEEVTGYFYNPNIHPYEEYQRRAEALLTYAKTVGLAVLWAEEYDCEAYGRELALREEARCRTCYHLRLKETARRARAGGFDAFTTTLLYSRFQAHQLIRERGEQCGEEEGIRFFYHDFREGWQEGIRISRELGLYRQSYCGCAYSKTVSFSTQRGKPDLTGKTESFKPR